MNAVVRAFFLVTLMGAACLLVRASRVGLAGDYVDPVTRISAQDEALYANTSIHMATRGNWLTPMFMGRYAFYKPPMLYWAAGLSARLLGVSPFSLRLPSVLLCALALGLVFLWAAEMQGWIAGACAALLLASNHLWHVLGTLSMTDALLVAFYIAAMYCIFSDPWLESRWCFWGFAASVAAAILTKGIAGTAPLAVFGLYWLLAKHRPPLGRACAAVALAFALAAPWFLYQLAVHPRWFWLEHVQIEIFGYGAGAPPQTSRENPLAFYFDRLALVDPFLLALFLIALPAFVSQLRKRSAEAVLLASWITVTLAMVLVWQYRSISYLLPLFPAMAITAASYRAPFSIAPHWLLSVALLALALKLASPAQPWGISFHRGTIQRDAAVLADYARLGRNHELIHVGFDDDLLAATMPLRKLRYCFVGGKVPTGNYGMPFADMGIIVSAQQFNELPRLEPLFRSRLREWGLDSSEPIGTLIMAESPQDLADVIRAHPQSDFLVPPNLITVAFPSHDTVQVPGHALLLARDESADAHRRNPQ